MKISTLKKTNFGESIMLNMSCDSKGTLLLVDDEVNIVNSLRRIFAPLKYNILTANNGCEGLEVLEKNQVDIIISDMRMPEMDGATFLKKASEQWPEVSRILLTGYADINSAIAAINDGQIDYYLNKPWQPNELENTIQNIMDKRALIEKNKLLQIELSARNEDLAFLNNNLEEVVTERTLKLERAYKRINQSYSSVIQILSSLCEQQGSTFKGYLKSVAKLSQLLAEQLGLPEKEVQIIHTAGLLHTLGKIGLPENILNQPYTKLSNQERVQFENYPLLGGTILIGLSALEKVASLITTHRELINGKGYPNKLVGNSIPQGKSVKV
jgi:response regulator RpfG family c-di-GMP phosphodiesterase